ncbi:hypothetical protein BrevBR_15500 [Brevundimonas sp. BR2-1]|uniref:hypothetical protein n=1 Tax=Brevundimonas sp. BR2-1 TaxID=3031123 RepID=UPI0030A7BE8B
MGRFRDWAGQARTSLTTAVRIGVGGGNRLWAAVVLQVRQTIDHNRWSTATTWRDRAAAVSWPRASIGGVLAAAMAVCVWIAVQPPGVRSHPPRLPTEREWRANQAAAEAMEAELSPALAAANRTVGPGDRP